MLHIIPDIHTIESDRELEQLWQVAYEYNDFFHPELLDDSVKLEERIQRYLMLERDRSHDTLHGVFLDIAIHSQDAKITEISRMRMRQSMEIASRLQAKAVIFHTNLIAGFHADFYEELWLSRNEEFINVLLEEFPKMSIYIENMFDDAPDLLRRLAERMKNSRFGICLDIAHANITRVPMEEWFRQLAPWIKHLHLNDNDGIEDLHQSVGDGVIDWQLYDELMKEYEIQADILVEVSGQDAKRKSLEYMKEKGIYPL